MSDTEIIANTSVTTTAVLTVRDMRISRPMAVVPGTFYPAETACLMLGHQRACCLITVAEYAFTECVLAFNHSTGGSLGSARRSRKTTSITFWKGSDNEDHLPRQPACSRRMEDGAAMSAINENTAAAWRIIAATTDTTRPSVGRRVRVTGGRKHLGKIGVVQIHERNKFNNEAYRYGSDAQHHMRDMAGRSGWRCKILTDDGEAIWVDASKTEVLP
jgi:hypothetical protein